MSPLSTEYIYPTRVIWEQGNITNSREFLKVKTGQATLVNDNMIELKNVGSQQASVILDFGKEINGSVELVTGMTTGGNKTQKVRLRFGESVSETNAEIGLHGATNDHAMRDFTIELPWLGKNKTGETGFRFLRIDLLGEDTSLLLREVRAAATYRDIPYVGSFKSSDERLNKIWEVGAYTVHVNMQDYLWDAIKRDRLVWVGDLHPEVATINTVFGYNDVVPKSLDLARETTPLPNWMCGISTYSMWWIIIHHDWYMHHADVAYLKEQQEYLAGLVRLITSKIGPDSKEFFDGTRFLDWPSSDNPEAIHAGLQAMALWSLEEASKLAKVIGDVETMKIADEGVMKLKKYIPAHANSKQAAALLGLTGLGDAQQMDSEVISVGGAKNFSTFYGYYMLQTMAKAENYQAAIDIIRNYWGAMLDLGATTFWEDFNMDWLPNAARIDELVPQGKIDIHASFGDYCYQGFRHSFSHGWASGPTAWMTEHILGIKVVEAGAKTILVRPNLGDLKFAEGTFPTPFGPLFVRHEKQQNKSVKTIIKAPKGVKIIR
ncbi:alpha-L-rhamnosidase C-terminal domain-containing protein [Rhinopithecimicrobium faecis]